MIIFYLTWGFFIISEKKSKFDALVTKIVRADQQKNLHLIYLSMLHIIFRNCKKLIEMYWNRYNLIPYSIKATNLLPKIVDIFKFSKLIYVDLRQLTYYIYSYLAVLVQVLFLFRFSFPKIHDSQNSIGISRAITTRTENLWFLSASC